MSTERKSLQELWSAKKKCIPVSPSNASTIDDIMLGQDPGTIAVQSGRAASTHFIPMVYDEFECKWWGYSRTFYSAPGGDAFITFDFRLSNKKLWRVSRTGIIPTKSRDVLEPLAKIQMRLAAQREEVDTTGVPPPTLKDLKPPKRFYPPYTNATRNQIKIQKHKLLALTRHSLFTPDVYTSGVLSIMLHVSNRNLTDKQLTMINIEYLKHWAIIYGDKAIKAEWLFEKLDERGSHCSTTEDEELHDNEKD